MASVRGARRSGGDFNGEGHQPELCVPEAGPAPAAEDHGRVCGRAGRLLDHERADAPQGPGADGAVQAGPSQDGGLKPSRSAAVLGNVGSLLVRAGAHATSPVSTGNALAWVLL